MTEGLLVERQQAFAARVAELAECFTKEFSERWAAAEVLAEIPEHLAADPEVVEMARGMRGDVAS